MNIVSPGGFPNTITASDIEAGRSEARNKVIANVFKTLGLIEQWGSGIKRIKSSCLDHGLSLPQIAESGDFVDVEIYRSPLQATIVADDLASDTAGYRRISPDTELSHEKQLIIDYVTSKQQINSKQVEALLALKERRVREILSQMVKLGLLVRKGSGPKTYYVLNI